MSTFWILDSSKRVLSLRRRPSRSAVCSGAILVTVAKVMRKARSSDKAESQTPQRTGNFYYASEVVKTASPSQGRR
jgi:hypothetical protein